MDRFRDGSGLFGVAGHPLASRHVALGLRALRHRGGGGAALAASEGGFVRVHRGSGPLSEVLGPVQVQALAGRTAIGHVFRLPDPGASLSESLEPAERLTFARIRDSRVAAVVNGRFTNSTRLRQEVADRGAVLQGMGDAELLLHLLALSTQRTIVNRLVDALWKVEGAYAVLVLADDRLIAVRDPRGFRPLVLGRIDDAVAIASEESALREAEGDPRREIRPGEMVIADARGAQSLQPFQSQTHARCTQEVLGVARPDAGVFGLDIWAMREALGLRLWQEAPVPSANLVVPLGDRAEALAVGMARGASLPVARALLEEGRRWNGLSGPVSDRAAILAAASLAEGDEARSAVIALRSAGAREVHVRVGSPPVRAGCRFGIIAPTTDELAASGRTPEAIADWLGADSVAWLADMAPTLGDEGWCRACMGGEIPLEPEEGDDQLTLF
jgi:amidophosphoribosyltransferase